MSHRRRFLATNHQQRDYVDLPIMGLYDEPEALTAEEHKRHIDQDSKRAAEQQQAYEQAQREKERRLMTFDQRLAKAQHEAKKRHLNISGDVWVLRQMQRAGRKVRHLEQRLGALERKVFREDRP